MIVCDGLSVCLEELKNPLGSEKGISGGENPLWDIAQLQGRAIEQAGNVCHATLYIFLAQTWPLLESTVWHIALAEVT